MTKLETKQRELIAVLWSQVIDLSTLSKIELGDDVIEAINNIKKEIQEIENS